MTTLGERMKEYEYVYRDVLPRRTYTLLRLDGRAFHTYTKGLDKPYDSGLMSSMDWTAQALCKEISGTQFAYVQSDEISLLVTDFDSIGTQAWMGGVVPKVLSLSAARATATFNRHRDTTGYRIGPDALFDSRVWTIPDPNEVGNYFIWRQRDAIKNSVTMAAQTVYSHKELEGLNTTDRLDALLRKGVLWSEYPAGFKRGRVVTKETYTLEGGAIRTRWITEPAPNFTLGPDEWLNCHIPPPPVMAT